MSEPAIVTELPSPLDVHEATLADILGLRVLWEAFLNQSQPVYPTIEADDVTAWTEQVVLKLAGDPAQQTFHAWIAYDGREPIGFLAGEVKFRLIGKPRVYAAPYWLYVRPDYRGRGVAPKLLKLGLTWLEATGIGVLELTAMPGDTQWIRRGWMPTTVAHAVELKTLTTRYLTRGGRRGR